MRPGWRIAVPLLATTVVMVSGSGQVSAQWLDLDVPERPVLEPSGLAAQVEAGRGIYEARCWFCHGEEGDGEGPVAPYLWPRPRDFTVGSYKLRTTHSGELPTDEDLYRTIALGVPGTAMPEWGSTLSAAERWQVIAYIKSFAADLFEDEAFDPYRYIAEIAEPPADSRDSLVAWGRRVFDEADCWECHGEIGRGDGERAAELEDDWSFPVPPANLHLGWKLKGGGSAREIYTRLTTGLDGTPMPSYAQTSTDEERWQLAYYIAQLAEEGGAESSTDAVVRARRVAGDVPSAPDDPSWESAAEVHIPVTGQATFAPRWQIPAVTDMAVRALYSADEVAVRIEWDDRYADTTAAGAEAALSEGWSADDTYPALYPGGERVRGQFADAVELMLPARLDGSPELPHLVYGSAAQPVELIRWRADSGAPGGSAVELRATGATRPPTPRAPEETAARAQGSWQAGRWSVVVRRPLSSIQGSGAPDLVPGESSPIAFHVWEGANGETGLKMAISSWYYLYLDQPMRARGYLTILLVVVGVAASEWGLARAIRGRAERGLLDEYGVRGGVGDLA